MTEAQVDAGRVPQEVKTELRKRLGSITPNRVKKLSTSDGSIRKDALL